VAVPGSGHFSPDPVFFQDKFILKTTAPFPGMIQGVLEIAPLTGHNGSGAQGKAQDFLVAVPVYTAFTQGKNPDITVWNEYLRHGGSKEMRYAPNIGVYQVGGSISRLFI
jgi:hypothetical protein